MAELSEKFKRLASASGRHIQCRIRVGAVTFTDDSIIKFDLADIAHPDWFTIGTSCPNEFSFTVRTNTEFVLHTSVIPSISFDGEEWVRMGKFYIAKRYIRGDYATIVCYDKLHDFETTPVKDTFPLMMYEKSDTLLSSVCFSEEITFKGTCASYSLPELSYTPMVGELIGFIAAMNGACAKLDRDGDLVFKKYSEMPTKIISADNCFRIRRNITRAGISGLRVNTGTDILRYGVNTGLSMVDLYNPYMTQEIVDAVGAQLEPLYFYGAEVEMQGLPYLEAGDLMLLEDTDGTTAPIMLSEIRYHYNGALTAELFSRNKTDDDTVVHRQEFEDALAALWDYVRGK